MILMMAERRKRLPTFLLLQLQLHIYLHLDCIFWLLTCVPLDVLFVCCGIGFLCSPCYPGATNLLLYLPSTLLYIEGSSCYLADLEKQLCRVMGLTSHLRLGCRNGDVALRVFCRLTTVPFSFSSKLQL